MSIKTIKLAHVINIVLVTALIAVVGFGYYYFQKTSPYEIVQETVAPVNPDTPPAYLFAIYGSNNNRIIEPTHVYVDNNRIYVSDRRQSSVLVFDYNGNFIFKFGSNKLREPQGIVIVNGEIYVADSGTRLITVFGANGNFLRYFAEKKPYKPFDIEYKNELFYVTDATRQLLYVYDPSGKEVLKLGGRNNENIKEEGKFYFIWDVAVDSKGNIYVTDPNLNRVQVFDPAGKFIKALGSKAPDNTGGFSIPRGIAIDKNDNIYIVSTLGNRVDLVKPDGTKRFSFSETAKDDKTLAAPSGIHVDANNRIFVADQLNSRIVVYKAK